MGKKKTVVAKTESAKAPFQIEHIEHGELKTLSFNDRSRRDDHIAHLRSTGHTLVRPIDNEPADAPAEIADESEGDGEGDTGE